MLQADFGDSVPEQSALDERIRELLASHSKSFEQWRYLEIHRNPIDDALALNLAIVAVLDAAFHSGH